MAGEQRKLAAILAADVVGYSKLMGSDEAGTLAAVKALRSEIIDPIIGKYSGRLFKAMGDGFLVEFASAVQAVTAAIAIQKAGPSLPLRVGIHLGDVVVEGDDLMGDGVNIAVRIEGVAQAGGVALSREVHVQVRDKLDVGFEDKGEIELKNIARPVHVFVIGDRNTSAQASTLTLPEKPSIAVLPFQNMSGDPEQEYFADGIVEDIITALSRFRHLFVIARNSSFTYKGRSVDIKQVGQELGVRYVLEGSVRKSSGRVRITGQLIDSATGGHLWAERYDRALGDIFALQDEITSQVAGAIEPELLKIESDRAAQTSKRNLSAWDLVSQGRFHFHQVTADGHRHARELFRQAVERDPRLADGHIWLARVDAGMVAFGLSDISEVDLHEGLQAAHHALRIDEKDPYAHYALAIVSVFSDLLPQAIRAAESAIEISPSFALGHYVLGLGRLFSGDAAGAIDAIETGLRLNPYDPQNFVWITLLSTAYFFEGQQEKALQMALRSAKIRPDWLPTLETLAVCYAALNRTDEARAWVEKGRLLPPFAGDLFALMKSHNPAWRETVAELLHKAGLR